MLLFVQCGNNAVKENTSNTTNNETQESVKGLTAIYDDYKKLMPRFETKSDSIYIINFWATWCAPCVKELPYFEKIAAEYKDKNVKLLLVSLDFKKQIDTRLKPFITEKDLQSEVVALIDPNSNAWIDAISKEWSGAIPATIIFNKNKRKFFEGSFNYEQLEKELKAFL